MILVSESADALTISDGRSALAPADDGLVFADAGAGGDRGWLLESLRISGAPVAFAADRISAADDGRSFAVRGETTSEDPLAVDLACAIREGMLRIAIDIGGGDDTEPLSVELDRRVLSRRPLASRSFPVNRWERNSGGGIPFQRPVGRVAEHVLADGATLWEASTGVGAFDPGADALRCAAHRAEGGAHRVELWLAPFDATAHGLAAAISRSDVGIATRTDTPFNLVLAAEAEPRATVELFSWGRPRDVTASWRLRGFDGEVVGSGSESLRLQPGRTDLPVVARTVGRGVYFLEASVDAASGRRIGFTRTSIAVMEPNALPERPTRFGLAAFRFHGGRAANLGEDEWAALSRQLGATRKRQVPEHTLEEFAKTGWRGLHQPPVDLRRTHRRTADGPIDDELRRRGHEEHLELAERFGCRYVEYGNELGATSPTDPAGGAVYARDYVIPLDEYLRACGSAVRVCSAGTQGPSLAFLEAFADAGGWAHTEAIAHHPGRGNFAPDWAPDPETWTTGTTGTYWNFLGGLRAVRAKVRELDERHGTRHELLLTEVYAPTYPNSWWEDTYRTSAENTLLEMALCVAEDVDEVYWYCANDGIWQDLEIAAPAGTGHMAAREYHFGLLHLDCSLKPSAMAFATGTQHLSDATFRGWIAFTEDEALRGLLFDTPRGELQILWSRADGYVLNPSHADEMFVADDGAECWDEPEPWVDVWPTKTTMRLAAPGATATELTCLGQERRIAAEDGRVPVVLDGAPRLYYGLAAPQRGDDGRYVARAGG